MLMIWYKQWKYRLPERQDWAEGAKLIRRIWARIAVQAWQARWKRREMADDILSGDDGADVRLRSCTMALSGASGYASCHGEDDCRAFDCMPTMTVSVMRHDPGRCSDQCSSTADRKFYNVWLLGGLLRLPFVSA